MTKERTRKANMKKGKWYIRNLDDGLVTDDGVTPTEFDSKKEAMDHLQVHSTKKIFRGFYEVVVGDEYGRTHWVGTGEAMNLQRWE
tara:strand:+ start:12065 stop:12322 length:258 start_codon:yes stop_codon:yes gene_type:complete